LAGLLVTLLEVGGEDSGWTGRVVLLDLKVSSGFPGVHKPNPSCFRM
jgi:hypothetical protein